MSSALKTWLTLPQPRQLDDRSRSLFGDFREIPMSAFNFCKMGAAIFLLWTAIGLTSFFVLYANTVGERSEFPAQRVFALAVGNSWLRAALTFPLILILTATKKKAATSRVFWALLCILLFLVFLLSHAALRPVVLPFVFHVQLLDGQIRYAQKFLIGLRSFFLDDLWSFVCIFLGFHLWDSNCRAKWNAIEREHLSAHLAQAELRILKMQLQPHFLFNTLNTIHGLAEEDPRKAQLMISRLSKLLRLSMEHTSSECVPLQCELQFLDNYLDIEKVRFGDRLVVTRSIEPAALDAMIPSMLLQPLLENAIRHGISKRAHGGVVKICAEIREARLQIRIWNDPPPDGTCTETNGIGLGNARSRLTQFCGIDSQLLLTTSHGGVEVLIDIALTATRGVESSGEPE